MFVTMLIAMSVANASISQPVPEERVSLWETTRGLIDDRAALTLAYDLAERDCGGTAEAPRLCYALADLDLWAEAREDRAAERLFEEAIDQADRERELLPTT